MFRLFTSSTNYAIGQIRSHATEKIIKLIRYYVWVLCFFWRNEGSRLGLTLYYSTVKFLKPTLITNCNYLNLVRNKNLKFPDFSFLFFPITMKLFLLIQHKGFKCKMGVFDKFLKILPISSFWCKNLISLKIFPVEIKRIRVIGVPD